MFPRRQDKPKEGYKQTRKGVGQVTPSLHSGRHWQFAICKLTHGTESFHREELQHYFRETRSKLDGSKLGELDRGVLTLQEYYLYY
jgi:hypothetical protein